MPTNQELFLRSQEAESEYREQFKNANLEDDIQNIYLDEQWKNGLSEERLENFYKWRLENKKITDEEIKELDEDFHLYRHIHDGSYHLQQHGFEQIAKDD